MTRTMAMVSTDRARVQFERPRSTEADDIRQIVRGILTLQARFAKAEHGPLQRGTHAKGICARAVFEVLDVRRTVRDPRLAARLARGLFAQPGAYPATVRFANASGQVRSDAVRDVRALSFAVEVAPGLVGPAVTRLDFSANSAPIFPINDAHAFATLMRVLSADGAWRKLRTVWSLPLGDIGAIGRIGVLGALQTKQPVRAYQSLRYWSTVPFRHGPDEAIKYSAIPSPENPVQPLAPGQNCLRDELARHLRDDAEMSTWEFGLQLLDAEVMTRRGRRRDPSYWVENAAVEWNEAQAPFHTVARLTLVPGSELSDEAARAMYIDVTEHTAPGGEPIGSINRARWSAESSSREARATGVVDLPAPVPLPRSRRNVRAPRGVRRGTAACAGSVRSWPLVHEPCGRLSAAARARGRRPVPGSGMGTRRRCAEPAGVLLHAAGRVDAQHPVQLVHQCRAAVPRRALRGSGSHEAAAVRRRSVSDAEQPRPAPGRLRPPLRRLAPGLGRGRHLLGLPHRAAARAAAEWPRDRRAHRRRAVDERLHRRCTGQLPAGARRSLRNHAGQSDQIQPLCAPRAGARVELVGASDPLG